jgi:cell division protein FtsL
MGRILNAVLLAVMVTGAAITYTMKHDAEAMANRVGQLAANIAKEREAIGTLKAEWSMLTQPGRLQQVIEKYADHFRLQPFAVSQVAEIGEIPLKPVMPDPTKVEKTIADIAAGATIR